MKKLKNEYKNIVNTEIPKYVLAQLNEVLDEQYDIVIIDRSLFDRCIWIDRLFLKKGISDDEVNLYYEKYIEIIKNKIDVVVATYCDSNVSMKRDYEANLSLEKRNFLNEDNVNEYNVSLKNTIDLLEKNNYQVNLFDTNKKSMKEIEFDVVECVLKEMKDRYLNEFNWMYK